MILTLKKTSNFLLSQQDELKQFIPKGISYHYSFERYTCSYLPSFSLKEREKLDLLSNENSKYLLYNLNDWIESMGVEKNFIRHTSKVTDEISVQKIEEKDKQFLIGKYSKDREPEIVLKIEKNCRVRRHVYQGLFYEIAETFI